MAAAQAPLVPALEEALQSISVERSAEMVRRVADFFLAGASRFSAAHIQLFDDVLGRLIDVADAGARAGLARRLAPVRNAPANVLLRLARDDEIAVAAPVIARSAQLDDDALVAIAATKSQAHLLAVSGRVRLAEAVTDALADRGDRDVVRNLAMNPGARFSSAGLATLAQRAADDGVVAEKLVGREDVPLQAARDVFLHANPVVRARLLATAPPALLTEFEQMASDAVPADAAGEDEAALQRSARTLQRAGNIDEAHVLEFVQDGRTNETIAALAVICNVSLDVVHRLMSGEQPDAALILCQAAGFSPPTARAILHAGERAPTPAAVDEAFAGLDRLSPATAEQIVEFWRACHGELRAAG